MEKSKLPASFTTISPLFTKSLAHVEKLEDEPLFPARPRSQWRGILHHAVAQHVHEMIVCFQRRFRMRRMLKAGACEQASGAASALICID